MKDIAIIKFKRTPALTVYSTKYVGEQLCELEKFIVTHKNGDERTIRDLRFLMSRLENIFVRGSLERYFKTEGKVRDRLCALPMESGILRLYCLRITDNILIVGGGGIKKSQKYQDTPELNDCAETLQEIDDQLRKLERSQTITISGDEIIGIENAVFKVKK